MNNKSKVQNPLTIIAIFAGIAELAGTTVLLGLPLEIQRVFVWFVMLFPIGLVAAFFLVLVFKHDVLYAPSDFKDENHFMNLRNANKQINSELAGLTDILEETKEIDSTTEQTKEKLNQAINKVESVKNYNEIISDYNYSKSKKIKNQTIRETLIQNRIITQLEIAGDDGLTTEELALYLDLEPSDLRLFYLESMILKGVISYVDNKWKIL
ncbi:hypothetical protein NSQ38_15735 [Paenibacillus sp. FSL R7-0313]|uniref:hypothetical protein n=1 Tax=Paenibacillus sp. FSL R7-0313 TaxID=2954532 RepID=UPI0030DA8E7E